MDLPLVPPFPSLRGILSLEVRVVAKLCLDILAQAVSFFFGALLLFAACFYAQGTCVRIELFGRCGTAALKFRLSVATR